MAFIDMVVIYIYRRSTIPILCFFTYSKCYTLYESSMMLSDINHSTAFMKIETTVTVQIVSRSCIRC